MFPSPSARAGHVARNPGAALLWAVAAGLVFSTPRSGAESPPALETLTQPFSGLRVTYDLPDDPSAACAETPAPALGLESGQIAPDLKAEVSRCLGVLQHTNAELAAFLCRNGYVALPPGKSMELAPLPPYSNAVIYAWGATPDILARRTVQLLPGKLTEVHFTADELFPVAAARLPFRSRLCLQATKTPVAGAVVDVKGYCFHAAVTSDAQGDFAFDQVPAGRKLTFRIRAKDRDAKERFDTDVTRVMYLSETVHPEDISWDIPARRRLKIALPPGETREDEAHPLYGMDIQQKDGSWRWGRVLDYSMSSNSIQLVVSEPGTWRARIHEGFFMVRTSEPVAFSADDYERTAALPPAHAVRATAEIQVRGADGQPASGAVVAFAPFTTAGDMLNLVADTKGSVSIGPLNVDEVYVSVDDARGQFSRMLRLEKKGPTEVQLTRSEPKQMRASDKATGN